MILGSVARSSTRTSPGAYMTPDASPSAPSWLPLVGVAPTGPDGHGVEWNRWPRGLEVPVGSGLPQGIPGALGAAARLRLNVVETARVRGPRGAPSSSSPAVPASPPTRSAPPRGRGRRVPGLRRSEGRATPARCRAYYARLERGQIAGASDGVLDALARALQLDETRARPPARPRAGTDGIRRRRRRRGVVPRQGRLQPSLRWALEAIADGVAFVRDPHQNLCHHQLARPHLLLRPVIGDGERCRTSPGSSSSTCLARLLPGLGPVRRDVRRGSCARGRARPPRPRTAGPRR